MVSWLVYFILVFVFSYTSFLVLLYAFQEVFIFKSKRLPIGKPLNFQSDYEEEFFDTTDKGTIHTVLFKSKSPSKGLIFYLHGARGYHEYWEEIAANFTGRDWDCLMIDYRGYGKSRGRRSSSTMLKDVEDIYQVFLNRYAPQNIIIYGRSLGSTFACFLASQKKARSVILETPLYSIERQASRKSFSRWIPFAALLKYKYNNSDWITKVSVPILALHGTEDETVPLSDVQDLVNCSPLADLVVIEGGSHFDLYQYDTFQSALDKALK